MVASLRPGVDATSAMDVIDRGTAEQGMQPLVQRTMWWAVRRLTERVCPAVLSAAEKG